MKKSNLKSRAKIVNYLYVYELLNLPLNAVEAFESGDFSEKEVKIIEAIAKNYDRFKTLIIKYLAKSWSWNRLAPYIRSILLYGSFDFLVNDKKLVINELVVLTKAYAPDDSYKFVNGILDRLGEYYEKLKGKQRKTKKS